MADREKVIKGLEGIYRCISPVNHTCGDCPYQDNHVECVRRALSDALELLKEKEIGYREKSDALLKMWMDNDITDGEYGKIMNRLNKKTLNKKVKNDG